MADAEPGSGKSVLPFARVQKIIKADRDIPLVAREAVFLISLATEEFIKRIADASQKVAQREKRSIIQQRDLATVARRTDEFVFLDEVLPWFFNEPAPRRREPEKVTSGADDTEKAEGPLDSYLAEGSSKRERPAEAAVDDEITNENELNG